MDIFYSDWCENIIGGSLDSREKMTGQHPDVIMWIQCVANPGFMRLWWSIHQINLFMQLFYLAIPHIFYSKFTSITSYFFWQHSFILVKSSQCHLIFDTVWMKMINLTTWFDKHQLSVITYLEVKKPSWMPYNLLWIMMLIAHDITGIAAILCTYLQGQGMLMCNQYHILKHLSWYQQKRWVSWEIFRGIEWSYQQGKPSNF